MVEMEPEFMADAYDDLREDELANAPVRYLPGTHVVDDPAFCLGAMLRMQANLIAYEQQRLALVSVPYAATEESGRRARYVGIREGIRNRPHRQTADERNAAEVNAWHGPRRALKGERS